MKNLFLLLSFVLFGFTSFAQKTMLYKISGNGLTQPSYLYGTMHLTCDATLEKSTLDALANTNQLYLELDMDDTAMQTGMMSSMEMKEGKTIKDMLTELDWKLLDDFMTKNLGMSALLMNTIKPFLLSTLFLPTMLTCSAQSVEQELIKVTKLQQENIYGLETVDEQMAIFDAIPYEIQLEELMKSVKNNFVADKQELITMMELYRVKDLQALYKMMQQSDNKITADFQEEILNRRNSNWIPTIERTAKEKPTFFGVGAGHLPGPKGVIELLRARGYLVEAVQ